MNVYESVWSYVMVNGCIWWCMGVYMGAYNGIWMYIKVYDGIWM